MPPIFRLGVIANWVNKPLIGSDSTFHDQLRLLICSKMSELESNPPDEDKKPLNSFYDATSFNLNGDYFDNQVN